MIIRIDVTQEDIVNGVRSNACECPIALAINRKLKRETARVYPSCVVIKGRLSAILPYDAEIFIHRFDAKSKRIQPISFDLSFPDELKDEFIQEAQLQKCNEENHNI